MACRPTAESRGLVKRLEEELALYREEKGILEKNCPSGTSVESLDDIEKLIGQLYSLPHSGANLRQTVDQVTRIKTRMGPETFAKSKQTVPMPQGTKGYWEPRAGA